MPTIGRGLMPGPRGFSVHGRNGLRSIVCGTQVLDQPGGGLGQGSLQPVLFAAGMLAEDAGQTLAVEDLDAACLLPAVGGEPSQRVLFVAGQPEDQLASGSTKSDFLGRS